MRDDDVPVLIVGGSLVGLSTSLFLAWHGVPSLVVERHPATAIHPRAALVNQRTIEIYRSIGLEEEIVEASNLEFEQNGAIVSVETLGGRELEYYFRHINDGVEGLSPSPRLFITQIGLEPILHRRAGELGARLEYGQELVSLESDDEGVSALVRSREDDHERTIHAQYLVAADGPRSSVREHLGIPLRGHESFSNSITIYFRADVKPLLGERNLSVIYVFGPRLQGFFRFSKAGDAGFLVVNKALDADGVLTADLLSAPQIGVRQTRRLVGRKKMTADDWKAGVHYADEIGVSPSPSQKFVNVSVPYGALVPAGIDNVLAAGRHMASDAPTQAFMREIPQCWLTGQAAGVAAALSAGTGVAPAGIDVCALQHELERQGVHLRARQAAAPGRSAAS